MIDNDGSIPLSRAIMKERLRLLGHVGRRKDNRLPKIVLFGQPSTAKRKAGRRRLGWEDVIKKDVKEMETAPKSHRTLMKITPSDSACQRTLL
jgi:hypothetical protein